jgi:hypothetical protein
MSTRAVITFIDERDTFHVYKHHDGYPLSEHGVIAAIQKAMPLAWTLPRFEASEFACAFIAANKTRGGGLYLTGHWNQHGDLDYRYEVRRDSADLDALYPQFNNYMYVRVFDMAISSSTPISEYVLNDEEVAA